ncbi:MAG: ATP-binding protein [Hyphomicrobiaceae bacterium]|nr:ATP-binding protein [Hyphomicrobiaceae bacterium]
MTEPYPLSDHALDDRIAWLGTSGAGKTYAAGTAVEKLLDRKARVIVVDPLGVWWGLRVKANGKDQAYPVVIFGGARADIPITEHSGRVVGEAIAAASESCLIDLSELGTKSAERRFMLAFLDAMYRHASGEPCHLVFDEADLWAPQRAIEPQLQSLMENIVRRGRVKGYIPWLITQRPAVLSKDVLSQADGLVAMKLTSSQDRAALGAWIEGQANKSDEKRMLARMATLKRGQGVVWIPARGVLDDATFPEKLTFDSSATPKRGEVKRTASLKPLDLGKLKEQIAAIETERAKPKQGKAVAQQTAPNMQPTPVIMQPDPAALLAAEETGYRSGYQAAVRDLGKAVEALGVEPVAQFVPVVGPAQAKRLADYAAKRSLPRPVERTPSAPSSDLNSGAQRLLSEAQARFPCRFTWGQLAALTGRKARGGAFNTAKKSLVDGGHVFEVNGFVVPAVAEQRPAMTRDELVELWINVLPAPANELLAVVAQYPKGISAPNLAETTGRQPRGGSWNSAISMLRSNGLIKEAGRGVFVLGDIDGGAQ